jgi:hypothetical protein
MDKDFQDYQDKELKQSSLDGLILTIFVHPVFVYFPN